MDAGTTALGAAAVGGFVALGGAWFARGTTREQVRADAQTRHAHWLASIQFEAYVTYMAEWDKAVSEIGRAWEDMAVIQDPFVPFLGDQVEASNRLIDRTSKATDDVRLSYKRVEMLGPEDVVAAASRTWEALVSLRETATARFGGHLRETEWQALRDEARATLEEYYTVTGARLRTAPDLTKRAAEPTTAK